MIRPATEADLQAILDIYNDAVINTTAVYTYTPHTLDMRRQWFNEHREAGLPVFVLEEDGVIAGFATYGNFRPWPAYKYSIEHSIYDVAHLFLFFLGQQAGLNDDLQNLIAHINTGFRHFN